MICKKCGGENTRVLDTKKSPDGIKRVRECNSCGQLWKTIESPFRPYTEKEDFIIKKKLIPMAMKKAQEMVDRSGKHEEKRRGKDGREYTHCFRSQYFYEEMNRLKKEAGLINYV